MTENEAIEQFEEMFGYWYGNENEVADYIEAMKVAVSALKEIQQYRATGMTPEQIKEMQKIKFSNKPNRKAKRQCPNCGSKRIDFRDGYGYYCGRCGDIVD